MKRQFQKPIFIAIALVLVMSAVGCSIVNTRPRLAVSPVGPSGRPRIPPPIDIMITIRGWDIVQHRIIGETYGLGEIRFAGRFLFIDDLVFKLKATKVPDWYWLVWIPSVEKGMYEIRAKPYKEYSITLSPVEAPERFNVTVKIWDRTVCSHFMIDPNPCWGDFRVSGFETPILYLKNDQYPRRIWAAKLPKEDGVWTIHFTLIK